MEQRLSEAEWKLMEILWEYESVGSTALVKICLERYGWKKSTVYTMLKRMEEKAVIQNKDAMVIPLIVKKEALKQESEDVLERTFCGSVTNFFAAFLQDRKITKEEAQRLSKLIQEASENE